MTPLVIITLTLATALVTPVPQKGDLNSKRQQPAVVTRKLNEKLNIFDPPAPVLPGEDKMATDTNVVNEPLNIEVPVSMIREHEHVKEDPIPIHVDKP